MYTPYIKNYNPLNCRRHEFIILSTLAPTYRRNFCFVNQ